MSVTRLAVFDLDGTLIDSRRDLADSANEMLAGYGAAPPRRRPRRQHGRMRRADAREARVGAAGALTRRLTKRWRVFSPHTTTG